MSDLSAEDRFPSTADMVSMPRQGSRTIEKDLSELIYLLATVNRTDELSALPSSSNQKADPCHGPRLCTVSMPELLLSLQRAHRHAV